MTQLGSVPACQSGMKRKEHNKLAENANVLSSTNIDDKLDVLSSLHRTK